MSALGPTVTFELHVRSVPTALSKNRVEIERVPHLLQLVLQILPPSRSIPYKLIPATILDAQYRVISHEIRERRTTQPFTPELREAPIVQGALGYGHVPMVEVREEERDCVSMLGRAEWDISCAVAGFDQQDCFVRSSVASRDAMKNPDVPPWRF
ncbi:hypothetical protein ASPCAL00033 [Aspergillus calidoustus]|uniref:Uncharacterized protein n=1 Tax=Aspergillus calidoustus TaxID=454130 RepID=A0A0U5FTN2_ASPCI|nr:hypothetical protein ASPCAL00033 [Aspergillus calidoustus]